MIMQLAGIEPAPMAISINWEAIILTGELKLRNDLIWMSGFYKLHELCCSFTI